MDNPARRVIFKAMEQTSDILITGGGLSGTTLALALAQSGFSVTLIDALPKARLLDNAFDGRSYALALASTRLLSALGVWSDISPNTQPILEITASDGRAGDGPAPFFLHFDHAEIEEGPMGFMVEDRVLRRGLIDAVEREQNLTHLSGETVVAQDINGRTVSVTLGSGATLTGGLLIGCDGRRSGTGARAGIKRTGWEYGQTGLVCAIEHETPHGGVAHQFFMPAGPLAILPLPGNRSSIVWSEKTDTAKAINALSDEDYLAVLRPRFGDFLGQIKLAGARFTYPLNLTLANAFTAPRVALVGDAAHGVHPIAGQGLNLGLRDVGALAEVLVDARRRGEDFGAEDVLERYARWRRFDTATSALAMDGFNRLFSNDNPVLRTLRDAGLGVVGAMPGLRRRFIREAAGLTGEQPRLLQGRVL